MQTGLRFLVVPLLVLVILLGWRAFETPVPPSTISAVQQGMTQAQVRKVLGPPSRDYAGRQWTYTRFLTFGYVNVLFETNGTVLYIHREEF